MDKSGLLELSVIIVNYNVKYFLEQCLCSVLKASRNIEAEIFVTDNNSSDGSKAYLENKFPTVNFIWNDFNAGFAKANNDVIPLTKGKRILYLNPDTIVAEDSIEKCLFFLNSHQECGALGVKMIDGSGEFLRESKRSFPSASVSFYKMTGLASIFPSSKTFSRYYAEHLPDNETNEVDVLCGAFLMITRTALHKVKGFDEDFFMYGEDIDLCYRIKNHGFRIFYFPETSIIHFKGESTQKDNKDYNKHFYGAMKLFVNKHISKNKAIAFFLKTGINLSSIIARFKTKSRIGKTVDNKSRHNNVQVVCNTSTFKDLVALLDQLTPELKIVNHIKPEDVQNDMENVQKVCIKKDTGTVILCENGLSYKVIIRFMELCKGKFEFFIHSDKSNSIVGSNDKNSKGIFITRS